MVGNDSREVIDKLLGQNADDLLHLGRDRFVIEREGDVEGEGVNVGLSGLLAAVVPRQGRLKRRPLSESSGGHHIPLTRLQRDGTDLGEPRRGAEAVHARDGGEEPVAGDLVHDRCLGRPAFEIDV